MICDFKNDDCKGAVNQRHDGRDLCWAHWAEGLETAPGSSGVSPATNADLERRAKRVIRDEIHRRDGIVMGRDPLGRRCGCESCQADAEVEAR